MKTDLDKAMSLAYRLLTYRRRTRREMESHLGSKGFSKDITRSVLCKMERYGYIDDKIFAGLWVEQRLVKRGILGLQRELIEKGVENKIIEEVLSGVETEEEYQSAMNLAKTKVQTWGSVYSFRRLAGLLGRRGYTPEVIYKVCRVLCDNGYNGTNS